MLKHGWRVSQVVSGGEGFIALIHGAEIVARFTNWDDARKAYRLATARHSVR